VAPRRRSAPKDGDQYMTLEEMRAREAIRQTQARYNAAGDRGRIAELTETFTEDGILEVTQGTFRGRAEIAAVLGSVAEGTGDAPPRPAGRYFVRHNLTTCHIELTSPTTADARTYFLVMTPAGVDHCGVYTDKFIAQGSQWLIAYRRVRIDWASPDTFMLGGSSA
jgi:hypothetical protein